MIVIKKRIKIIIEKNQRKGITKNIENLIGMREEGAKRIQNTKIKMIDQKTMIKDIKRAINMIKGTKKVINIAQDTKKMIIIKSIRRMRIENKILIKINHVTNKEMIIIDIDQYQKVDLDLIHHLKMKINKKLLWLQQHKLELKLIPCMKHKVFFKIFQL